MADQQKMKKRMDNKRDAKPGRAKTKGTGSTGAKPAHGGKDTAGTNRARERVR